MSISATEHQITCCYGVMTSELRLYLHKTVTQVSSTCNKPVNEMLSTSEMKVLLNHGNFSLVLTNIFDNSHSSKFSFSLVCSSYLGSTLVQEVLGWGQTVQHCWCNTLLISALLSKNKEVVGENNSVASTMLYSLTSALLFNTFFHL